MSDIGLSTGLYFEDYEIGTSITTPGRTVTEADIVNFAMLSGDWNPLHTDAVTAKETPYGQRIAHGLLVLSMATGMIDRLGFMSGTVIGFMGLEWQFRAPVVIGDTVHVVGTVDELKPMKRLGGGFVTVKLRIVNQDGTVTQRGSMTVLVKSRAD